MSDQLKRAGSTRIESIDVIRGLTILVMIFVNDLAGVANVPGWMKHYPTPQDGMTFVDVVFPAFLFIVGMSMPFSIGRRLEKDLEVWSTIKHILIRVFGLLLIGVLMVNSYTISTEVIFDPHIWTLSMYFCVIIIWNNGKGQFEFLKKKHIKLAAIFTLICLMFIYKGGGQTGFFQIRTQWWGILGLIGWAYLVASIIYIPFRKNYFALLMAVVILFCFFMADEAGLLSSYPAIRSFIHPSYAIGSHPAIVLLGALLGSKIKDYNKEGNSNAVLKWALGFSVSLFITGLLIHQLNGVHIMFIISKNLGTIPWCLFSSAYTIWIWMFSYWIIDMKGIRGWSAIVRPAGTNPLFAYILAPIFMECCILISYLFGGFDFYMYLGETFYLGLFRAIAVAFSMTWLTGFLSNRGIQLKL